MPRGERRDEDAHEIHFGRRDAYEKGERVHIGMPIGTRLGVPLGRGEGYV